MARIVVLYNTDYDSATGATDESAVEQSARAVAAALDNAELVGVHGRDVFEVLARVRASKPDLVFNLCESMDNNSLNEPTFAKQPSHPPPSAFPIAPTPVSATRRRSRPC